MKRILIIPLFVAHIMTVSINIETAGNTTSEISSDDDLIKAGISVGRISIGASRNEVRAIAGEPISSLADGDQYSDFVVHYEDDQVVEIIVTSPRYRTKEGLSIKTTAQQFLTLYPKSKVTCYTDNGASSVTNGKVYDAIDEGIAYTQDIFQGRSREVISTLTIHRANIPVKIYGKLTSCGREPTQVDLGTLHKYMEENDERNLGKSMVVSNVPLTADVEKDKPTGMFILRAVGDDGVQFFTSPALASRLGPRLRGGQTRARVTFTLIEFKGEFEIMLVPFVTKVEGLGRDGSVQWAETGPPPLRLKYST